MVNVFDVAKFFIYKDKRMTNLKLQKLCYYAQAWFGVHYNEKLFSNEFKAWDFGPVVGELYYEFKTYKSDPLPQDNSITGLEFLEMFNADELDLLMDVWESYGENDGYAIANKTHKEEPWALTYHTKGRNAIIPFDFMKDYYRGQLEEEATIVLESVDSEEQIEWMSEEETQDYIELLEGIGGISRTRYLELVES